MTDNDFRILINWLESKGWQVASDNGVTALVRMDDYGDIWQLVIPLTTEWADWQYDIRRSFRTLLTYYGCGLVELTEGLPNRVAWCNIAGDGRYKECECGKIVYLPVGEIYKYCPYCGKNWMSVASMP